MARENSGTQTIPCGECGTDVETNRAVDKSICPHCTEERVDELLTEDRHEVECRECGELTEAPEHHQTITCIDCLRAAGRLPNATLSV